ncbi:MAG TPA: hypothetical protein VGO62_12735 [Myxococcota bacterium]|jgi:hypothetical protein
MKSFLLVASLPVAALAIGFLAGTSSACAGNSSEGEGEGEGAAAGEGEGAAAGEGEGAAAGEGEGEGEGFSGQEYTGEAEAGVKCGDTDVCTAQSCCVVLDQSNFTLTPGCADTCDQGDIVQSICDGAEDCADGDECCLVNNGFTSFVTSCVAAGTCETPGDSSHATVCVTSADCAVDEECCGTGAGFLPIDMGACQPAANNCSIAPPP